MQLTNPCRDGGHRLTACLRVKASKDQLTNLSRIDAAGYGDLREAEGTPTELQKKDPFLIFHDIPATVPEISNF